MGSKDQHDAAHDHTRHVIARCIDEAVSITDFQCRACRNSISAEEYNIDPSIVFVRRGLFVRNQEGETVVAVTSQILFFNPQQPYRILHPIAGGDDCTILTISAALALEIVARHAPREAERSPWLPFVRGQSRAALDAWRMHYQVLSSAETSTDLIIDDLLLNVMDRIVCESQGSSHSDQRRISRGTRIARRGGIGSWRGQRSWSSTAIWPTRRA